MIPTSAANSANLSATQQSTQAQAGPTQAMPSIESRPVPAPALATPKCFDIEPVRNNQALTRLLVAIRTRSYSSVSARGVGSTEMLGKLFESVTYTPEVEELGCGLSMYALRDPDPHMEMALVEAVRNSALRELTLNGLRLTPAGWAHFGEALKTNTRLQFLALHSMELNEHALQALTAALRSNKHLKNLVLDFDPDMPEICAAFTCLLQEAQSLQSLKLDSDDYMTKDLLSSLQSGLKQNTSLRRLHIEESWEHQLTPLIVKRLVAALDAGSQLEFFSSRYLKIGPKGATTLQEFLQSRWLNIVKTEINIVGRHHPEVKKALRKDLLELASPETRKQSASVALALCLKHSGQFFPPELITLLVETFATTSEGKQTVISLSGMVHTKPSLPAPKGN